MQECLEEKLNNVSVSEMRFRERRNYMHKSTSNIEAK